MMKWGRRKAKPGSSSPSRSSTISHVFPMSWISKFKQKGSKNSEPKPIKEKEKQKANTNMPSDWTDGRFYGRDDESYWRLSFGEEGFDGEYRSRGGLRSVLYNLDDESEFTSSTCQNCRGGGEAWTWKFNDMVSDIRKTRELPEIVEAEKEEKRKEFEEPRRKAVKGEKSRKTSRRVLEEKREGLERKLDKVEEMGKFLEEKYVFELLEPISINQKVQTSEFGKPCKSWLNSRISGLKTVEEDCGFEAPNSEEMSTTEWLKLKEINTKIEELLSKKNEKQRKSACTSRKGGKVKAYSPRTVARNECGKVKAYSPRTVARNECKIKAIEDMKRAKAIEDMKRAKAKTKMKKQTECVERRKTGFDSFAVVKSSVDPQRDFRSSMIEMITEKQIKRSNEMEELLACYLTLNADEYHDVIIKVFRQVWFELNQE